ncbi:hypothetical protein R1sor_024397 [Riccia sorocarpa]|uniref:THUMP domain-containing protein n=1 Tax=Riccia sorocarpa TaxID=122646 RepID=A0ABD3GRZ3_9MARC
MGGEDQNAGGKSNKRKKRHAKYLQHGGKKSTISAGVQGFLITCVGGKERQAIKEAINLLDQFYEKPELRISGEAGAEVAEPSSTLSTRAGDTVSESKSAEVRPQAESAPEGEAKAEGQDVDEDEENEESSDEEDESEDDAGETLGWVKSRRLDESGKAQGTAEGADSQKTRGNDSSNGAAAMAKAKETIRNFDELLADEISELKDKKKARFVGYETGCNGVIFVRMHHQKGAVEGKGPKELAEAIVRDAAETKQSKTRHCMRLLPIELTCYASTAEMLKVAEPLIQRHFPVDQPSIKFAVVCEARANTNLKKMDFINAIAKLVPEPHSVDLKCPQKTILVQVVKTACAIGVVQDFRELAKYNLRQLTTPEPKTPGKASAE